MRNLQKLKYANERAFRKHGLWVHDESSIYTEADLKAGATEGAILHFQDVIEGDYVALMHNMMPTLLEAVEALKRLHMAGVGGDSDTLLLADCKAILDKL